MARKPKPYVKAVRKGDIVTVTAYGATNVAHRRLAAVTVSLSDRVAFKEEVKEMIANVRSANQSQEIQANG